MEGSWLSRPKLYKRVVEPHKKKKKKGDVFFKIRIYERLNCSRKRWWSWLRHCAVSQKITGSIPDGVIGIFHCLNPSGRTNGPGADLTSKRNGCWGYLLADKGSRCVGLTTLTLSCADRLEILGVSTSWNPKGLSRPVMVALYPFSFVG
jgi:hypothetical protein